MPPSPYRRYPQIYASEEKLLLDAKSIKVRVCRILHAYMRVSCICTCLLCVLPRLCVGCLVHLGFKEGGPASGAGGEEKGVPV